MNTTARSKFFSLALIAALLIISAGCASHTTSPTSDYNDPMNTKWLLEDIDGQGVMDFAHIWVRFDDDGKIYGSGGCNNFRGHFTITNGEFKTGPLAMTRKACPEAISLQEFKFMQALDNVRTMHTVNGLLYMEGDDHQLRFSNTY